MSNNFYENLVSIIIPSRNIDYILCKTIKEIRNLYKSVEIILVLDEINEYPDFKKDENIKILKSVNKNMSAKRNLGVKNSNSKYIALLDSDSYPKENWLENAVNFLEKNNDYHAVTGCQLNWQTDNYKQKCLRLLRFNRFLTHEDWIKIIDINTNEQDCSEFMTSNVFIRKKIYEDLNGMDENIYLAEDNEFSYRFIKNGNKIRFIPDVLVFHRESEFFPFLRKIYSMGYYYSNNLFKRKNLNVIHLITEILPLCLFFILILFYFLLCKTNINPNIILIIPLAGLLIIFNESYKIAKNFETEKYKTNKLKVFLFTYIAFVLYGFVYIFSYFLGLIHFPSKKVENLYKHY